MRFIDEPAERVESQLRDEEVKVKREPYNPRSRSLLSDFVGFLRTPDPGSTVTLFEDDDGRVRYYTVERPDPEVEKLRERLDELGRREPGPPEDDRLKRIEDRLERMAELEARVAKLPDLEERVKKIQVLEERVGRIQVLEEKVAAVDRLPALEEQVARIGPLEEKVAAVDKLPALEAKVTQLSRLDEKVAQIDNLRGRLERLERR
jgi:hypothetical protein